MHTIDNLDCFRDEYRQKGGGNFARWQQHSATGTNLYAGLERAPAIGEDDYPGTRPVGPEPLIDMGLAPCRIRLSRWKGSLNIDGWRRWGRATGPGMEQIQRASICMRP